MKIQRRRDILDYINEHGTVTIDELLDNFKVSKATINRDLTYLEKEGRAHKIHGGVISNKIQLTYEPLQIEKENTQKEFKNLIAKEAIKLIKNGMSIILDSGTTALALAKEINACKCFDNLVVITNDLKVSFYLSENINIKLIDLGGEKKKNSYCLIGALTEQSVRHINADIFFLCVDALDIDRGVSNANFEEIVVKREMMKSTNEIVLLADYTKFNKMKLAKVCDLDEIDMIITDYRITEEEKTRLETKCESLVVARNDGDVNE